MITMKNKTEAGSIYDLKREVKLKVLPDIVRNIINKIDIKDPIKYNKKQKKTDSKGKTKTFVSKQIFMSINRSDKTLAKGKIVLMDLSTLKELVESIWEMNDEEKAILIEEIENNE